MIVVSNLNSDLLSFIDMSFGNQFTVQVGSQPMDFAFRGEELFVGCQGDGTMHVIDIRGRRVKQSFQVGSGCEIRGIFLKTCLARMSAIGTKRTLACARHMSAFDPKRTSDHRCCCSPATYVRGAFFLSFRAYIHHAWTLWSRICAPVAASINTAMKGLCRNRRAAKEML